VGKAAGNAVTEFCQMMYDLRDAMPGSNPGQLIEALVKATGFEAHLTDDQEKGQDRIANVKELVSIAKVKR
jgi:DNA helicase-2/ATP-dependent DNA helicase PcrA